MTTAKLQISNRKHSNMKLIGAFLKLVRYPNLVFIFLTQYLLQYAVVTPIFHLYGIQPTLNSGLFFLLVLSTVLVAAAGNIINDYFDVNIDLVNKPDRVIIDRLINRRWAIAWHTILNVVGVALGFGVAWKIGYPVLGFTSLCCSGLLWFYSTAYKRQLVIGNVVISLLTALSVLIVGFYEPQLYKEINPLNAPAVYLLLRIILLYGAFAFLISMIRELVKDLEDVKGDSRLGCRTLPIVYGINASKDITFVFTGILVALIVFVQVKMIHLHWYFSTGYLLLLVQIPLVLMCIRLKKAVKPGTYHKVSSMIKWIMLAGILSMLFFIKW